MKGPSGCLADEPNLDRTDYASLERRLVLKDGKPAIAVEPMFKARMFAEVTS